MWERNTDWFPLAHTSAGDQAHNPGTCPKWIWTWPNLNWWPFALLYDAQLSLLMVDNSLLTGVRWLSLWFWFAFSWCLVMLRTFSCTCCLSVCFLENIQILCSFFKSYWFLLVLCIRYMIGKSFLPFDSLPFILLMVSFAV